MEDGICKLSQFDPAATQANVSASQQAPWSEQAPGLTPDPLTSQPTLPPASMKPTKFAKLLQVALPIIQGGAIGAFGGNWRQPGSGGQAANQFFQQQSERALQQRALQVKQQQDAAAIQLRQSEEKRNDFYDKYLAARTDREENPVEKPTPHRYTQLKDYPGMELDESTGETQAITRPAGKTSSGQSDLSNVGMEGNVPLGPPESQTEKTAKDVKPQPELVTDSDTEGVSTQHFVDKNPDSPTFGQRMSPKGGGDGTVARRAPKPERPTRLSSGQKVQSYAEQALQASGNDPAKATAIVKGLKSMDEDTKGLVIKEINKPKKSGADTDALVDSILAKRKAAPTGGIPTSP